VSRLVVVSVGTYHLPFVRLIEWMEAWARQNPEVRLVVQHGPTRPVDGAENHELMSHAALLDLCRVADAVVLQGGAGGIQDMRALGRMPIVVPRIPVDDEVVDDHQLRFAEEAERLGLIHRALDRQTLHRLLDDAVAGRLTMDVPADRELPGVGAVTRLLAEAPRSLSRGERARRLGRSLRGILADRRPRRG